MAGRLTAMPRVEWSVLLWLQTVTTLGAVGLASAAGRHCQKRVRAEPGETATALFRFRHIAVQLPVIALVAPFAMWEAEPRADRAELAALYFAVAWTSYVAAWLGVVWIVSRVWRSIRPDAPDLRAMIAGGLFMSGWFVLAPLVAGWATVACAAARPWPSAGRPNPTEALCFVFGLFVSTAFIAWQVKAATSPVSALPAAATEAFARAAGEGDVPPVTVARLRAAGLPIGYAVRRRRRDSIWIDADLVASYPPDETTAILLHELAHHRLGHVRRRNRTWKALLIAILVVPTFVGFGHVAVFLLATAFVRSLVLLPQWRSQELEADRFAADRVGPLAIGSALVRMHRAHDVPEDAGSARRDMQHPDLKRRLEALGLTTADVADSAPSGR